MASIFTKIVKGDIPAYKVAEDENYLAFLDISPVAKGHTLVIPKKEVDYLFDLDDELYSGLQLFAKKVATGLKKAVPCKKVGVLVLGLEVPPEAAGPEEGLDLDRPLVRADQLRGARVAAS